MPAFDVGAGVADQPQGNAWLAPGVVLTFAPVPGYRDIPLVAGTVVQLLGNNPQRVAFTVVRDSTLTAMPRIGPFPDVSLFALRADPAVDVRTFVLQDWLSLIIGDWWVMPAENGSVRVVEFQPSF